MRLVSLALIFVLLATASALAQDPSAKPATIAATVNKAWSGLERDLIFQRRSFRRVSSRPQKLTFAWIEFRGPVKMRVKPAT